MIVTFKDKIGFLPYENAITFKKGSVNPLESFVKAKEYIEEKANKDGFYYPPTIETFRQRHEVIDGKLEIFEDPVPKSKRPAHLFRMPASHEIQLTTQTPENDIRKGDGLFITYLVSFVFGIRLQFHDWLFDGRVRTHSQQDFLISHAAIEEFIEKAYDIWLNCSDSEKNLLTNLLYMHTKVQSYEWDWEQFIISYMVLDGCYKFLSETQGIYSRTHKDRIKTILDHFDMKSNMEWIDRIVNLRNDLFHESLWEGGQPGIGSTYSHSAEFHLSKLNYRVIFAILGHRGEYVYSPWWLAGTFMF